MFVDFGLRRVARAKKSDQAPSCALSKTVLKWVTQHPANYGRYCTNLKPAHSVPDDERSTRGQLPGETCVGYLLLKPIGMIVVQKSENGEAGYTIGQVAAMLKLTHRSIRHYEDCGLLRPMRTRNIRKFKTEDIERLRRIVAGKELGLTLREIAQYIDGDRSAAEFVGNLDVQKIEQQLEYLERQRADVEVAIARLSARKRDAERDGAPGGAARQSAM